MTDPTRHEVEYAAAGRDYVAIKAGERGDSTIVDMRDETRRCVEAEVIALVLPIEGVQRQPQFRRFGPAS